MIKNEDLHTPWKVRLVVGIIGVTLLVSTIAVYLGVFVQYGAQEANEDAVASEIQDKYYELSPIVSDIADKYSAEHFEEMKSYQSEVKGFNEEALEYGVRDLKIGDGRMIESSSDAYLSYYIGWQSDETILDSSFDDYDNPTSLVTPLMGTTSMIQGWLEGIIGMKIGGVREISIPAAYAYGDEKGALKFIVMLIPYDEGDFETFKEFDEVQTQLMYQQYGL